ncbi:MAG: DUF1329 domain-containing protein [Deltaproteobacteria bacterium]|nr:DUF1329 domain-containing protein [Deltaproteobacteria bacterium]
MTEEIVGLKSPDLVNKIAPEIKPGKYTYQDMENSPGLKDLFPPEFLLHIKPGGPPLIGSIPEFEITPTKQLYWYTKFCMATKDNLGKTKLDKDGYIVPMSWQGGVPFPRPSGDFKAQQVYYNFEKRTENFERCVTLNGESMSFDRNLKMDKYNQYQANFIRLMGRTLFPPYGFLDKRAERNGEFAAFSSLVFEPRANKGTVVLQYAYDDPNKLDPSMIYVPSLRRIRKMSSTDTQDPLGDMTYDDRSMLTQKITPKRYPYKFDIIAEREYLIPVNYNDSSVWIDSKNGLCMRDIQFMRRPCYVLQMTQLDNNYLYSKRFLYVDKENFGCTFAAYYDQKGRLYRSQWYTWTFMPEVGQTVFWGMPTVQLDHIDEHSTFQMQLPLPACFTRADFGIRFLIRKGK